MCIRRLEGAGQTKPGCAMKCAKLEDQLGAMRKEVLAARAAAAESRRTIACVIAELADARDMIDRLQR